MANLIESAIPTVNPSRTPKHVRRSLFFFRAAGAQGRGSFLACLGAS
jgi:hypothetical protein